MKRVGLLAVALRALPALAQACDAPGPRWPGGVIRYHESLPKSYPQPPHLPTTTRTVA